MIPARCRYAVAELTAKVIAPAVHHAAAVEQGAGADIRQWRFYVGLRDGALMLPECSKSASTASK